MLIFPFIFKVFICSNRDYSSPQSSSFSFPINLIKQATLFPHLFIAEQIKSGAQSADRLSPGCSLEPCSSFTASLLADTQERRENRRVNKSLLFVMFSGPLTDAVEHSGSFSFCKTCKSRTRVNRNSFEASLMTLPFCMLSSLNVLTYAGLTILKLLKILHFQTLSTTGLMNNGPPHPIFKVEPTHPT